MLKKAMALLILLIGGLIMSCTTTPETAPEYLVKRISRDLNLSGKVDDPLWQEAVPIKLVDVVTGKPGRFETTVRALYNDDFLYVAFVCADDYAWGTIFERDSAIYNQECVEVFVSPANLVHQYYEINVSPHNVIFDACILNNRTPDAPNNAFLGLSELDFENLEIKVNVQGQIDVPGAAHGWTAEYAIPLAEMIGAPNYPPQVNDVWWINFYRIDAPKPEQQEFYAWNPTGKIDFHRPWNFGRIRFGEE